LGYTNVRFIIQIDEITHLTLNFDNSGKPFAWGIMKTLIPDLPPYVCYFGVVSSFSNVNQYFLGERCYSKPTNQNRSTVSCTGEERACLLYENVGMDGSACANNIFVVYREVYRPSQPIFSFSIHDHFHNIIERVVLSPLSLQEFKVIYEKTGKRNFCNYIIKEVIKTTDNTSEMVGAFAANSIRAAELAGFC